MRSIIAMLALSAVVSAAQSPARVEFDVASIKRNRTTELPVGPRPNAPGQIVDRRVPVLVLLRRAYPRLTVTGLPGWAESDRYDVDVRFPPGTTAERQAEMWRTLLADRMKVQAHVETRELPAYRLVLARHDGTLGPQLKRSTLQCDSRTRTAPPEVQNAMMATFRDRRLATPQEEALFLSVCTGTINAWQTLYAGAIDMNTLIRGMSFVARPDRPVVDGTGLDGLFTVKLWAAPATAGLSDPNAPPTIFTALQDQLGLKLEPAVMEDRVLVIDHIEQPSEN